MLKVYSYSDGNYISSIDTEYYINAIKAIPKSDMVIIANGHFLRVYNVKKARNQSVRPYVFSYRAKDSILDVDFSHKTG